MFIISLGSPNFHYKGLPRVPFDSDRRVGARLGEPLVAQGTYARERTSSTRGIPFSMVSALDRRV